MARVKMSRQMRAKQFAPFDALKGLQDALRLKEFEHERVTKGEIQEDKAEEISKILINLEKGDILEVTYFQDGHNFVLRGVAKVDIENRMLQVGGTKIKLEDVLDLKLCEK